MRLSARRAGRHEVQPPAQAAAEQTTATSPQASPTDREVEEWLVAGLDLASSGVRATGSPQVAALHNVLREELAAAAPAAPSPASGDRSQLLAARAHRRAATAARRHEARQQRLAATYDVPAKPLPEAVAAEEPVSTAPPQADSVADVASPRPTPASVHPQAPAPASGPQTLLDDTTASETVEALSPLNAPVAQTAPEQDQACEASTGQPTSPQAHSPGSQATLPDASDDARPAAALSDAPDTSDPGPDAEAPTGADAWGTATWQQMDTSAETTSSQPPAEDAGSPEPVVVDALPAPCPAPEWTDCDSDVSAEQPQQPAPPAVDFPVAAAEHVTPVLPPAPEVVLSDPSWDAAPQVEEPDDDVAGGEDPAAQAGCQEQDAPVTEASQPEPSDLDVVLSDVSWDGAPLLLATPAEGGDVDDVSAPDAAELLTAATDADAPDIAPGDTVTALITVSDPSLSDASPTPLASSGSAPLQLPVPDPQPAAPSATPQESPAHGALPAERGPVRRSLRGHGRRRARTEAQAAGPGDISPADPAVLLDASTAFDQTPATDEPGQALPGQHEVAPPPATEQHAVVVPTGEAAQLQAESTRGPVASQPSPDGARSVLVLTLEQLTAKVVQAWNERRLDVAAAAHLLTQLRLSDGTQEYCVGASSGTWFARDALSGQGWSSAPAPVAAVTADTEALIRVARALSDLGTH